MLYERQPSEVNLDREQSWREEEGSEGVDGRKGEEVKGRGHLLGLLVHHRCSRASAEKAS